MAVLLKKTYELLSFLRKQKFIKLNGSTLIETLVASVIIIVVFTITSLTLNNVFRSTIKSDTQAINMHLNKLMYLYQRDKIDIKYREDFDDWHIAFSQQTEKNISIVVVEAVQVRTKKTISKKLIHASTQ